VLELSCRLAHLSVCLSVYRSVGLSMSELWKKTADWILMPFGVVNGIGRRMGVLDGLEFVEGKGQFWGLMWGISL